MPNEATLRDRRAPGSIRVSSPVPACQAPLPPAHLSELALALLSDPPQVNAIRDLAPQGFASPALRRRAWALLLGVTASDVAFEPPTISEDHQDCDQINKDVVRGCTRFTVCSVPQKRQQMLLYRALATVVREHALELLMQPAPVTESADGSAVPSDEGSDDAASPAPAPVRSSTLAKELHMALLAWTAEETSDSALTSSEFAAARATVSADDDLPSGNNLPRLSPLDALCGVPSAVGLRLWADYSLVDPSLGFLASPVAKAMSLAVVAASRAAAAAEINREGDVSLIDEDRAPAVSVPLTLDEARAFLSSPAAAAAASSAGHRSPREWLRSLVLSSPPEAAAAAQAAGNVIPPLLFARRQRLARLLHTLFSVGMGINYVQGFHDVISVVLLTCEPAGGFSPAVDPISGRMGAPACDERLALALSLRLARVLMRDSLQPTLSRVTAAMALVQPLVARADPQLADALTAAELTPHFTLSWLLTWFSHSLVSLPHVCRIFDVLLAGHPLLSVYLAAATVLAQRDAVLELPGEMPVLHSFFCRLGDDEGERARAGVATEGVDEDEGEDENESGDGQEGGVDDDTSLSSPSSTGGFALEPVLSITHALWQAAPPYLVLEDEPGVVAAYTEDPAAAAAAAAARRRGRGASGPVAQQEEQQQEPEKPRALPPLLLTDPSESALYPLPPGLVASQQALPQPASGSESEAASPSPSPSSAAVAAAEALSRWTPPSRMGYSRALGLELWGRTAAAAAAAAVAVAVAVSQQEQGGDVPSLPAGAPAPWEPRAQSERTPPLYPIYSPSSSSHAAPTTSEPSSSFLTRAPVLTPSLPGVPPSLVPPLPLPVPPTATAAEASRAARQARAEAAAAVGEGKGAAEVKPLLQAATLADAAAVTAAAAPTPVSAAAVAVPPAYRPVQPPQQPQPRLSPSTAALFRAQARLLGPAAKLEAQALGPPLLALVAPWTAVARRCFSCTAGSTASPCVHIAPAAGSTAAVAGACAAVGEVWLPAGAAAAAGKEAARRMGWVWSWLHSPAPAPTTSASGSRVSRNDDEEVRGPISPPLVPVLAPPPARATAASPLAPLLRGPWKPPLLSRAAATVRTAKHNALAAAAGAALALVRPSNAPVSASSAHAPAAASPWTRWALWAQHALARRLWRARAQARAQALKRAREGAMLAPAAAAGAASPSAVDPVPPTEADAGAGAVDCFVSLLAAAATNVWLASPITLEPSLGVHSPSSSSSSGSVLRFELGLAVTAGAYAGALGIPPLPAALARAPAAVRVVVALPARALTAAQWMALLRAREGAAAAAAATDDADTVGIAANGAVWDESRLSLLWDPAADAAVHVPLLPPAPEATTAASSSSSSKRVLLSPVGIGVASVVVVVAAAAVAYAWFSHAVPQGSGRLGEMCSDAAPAVVSLFLEENRTL